MALFGGNANEGNFTLTGNTACNNTGGPGIEIGRNPATGVGVCSAVLTGNHASFNNGDGISDMPDCGGGVSPATRNDADYNERYGIEASAQVTDGGGNVATHNELGSCVNLTCKS